MPKKFAERAKETGERILERSPRPVRIAVEVLIRTVRDWLDDSAPRLAAALSYFILIATAPILIVVVAVVGVLFERDEAREAILEMAEQWMGDAGVQVVSEVLSGAAESGAGGGVTSLGVIVALFGASVAFHQLQAALNIVWDVPEFDDGLLGTIKRRAITFVMVLIVGALLIAGMLFRAGAYRFFDDIVPFLAGSGPWLEWTVGLVGATILFTIIYTILPERQIDWRETLVGAFVTSLLFNVGVGVVGWYLQGSAIESMYGAAGSFAVFLVWLYYSSQIFLFGAEFTHVWAERKMEREPAHTEARRSG